MLRGVYLDRGDVDRWVSSLAVVLKNGQYVFVEGRLVTGLRRWRSLSRQEQDDANERYGNRRH